MKHFAIVKYHPCVQLAHLYEHLFVGTVSEVLYQQGQYKFLDYAINGETYESGVIIISAESYTATTQHFLEQLTTIKIDLGEDKSGYMPATRALSQLISEEPLALFVGDADKIIHELKKLDLEPWQNLDDVQQLPPKTPVQPETNSLIYTVDQPAKPPHEVILRFAYVDYETELLTLWHQFTHFLSLSIGQKICHDFHAYFSRSAVKLETDSAVLECTFLLNPLAHPNTNPEDILPVARNILSELSADDIRNRFIKYLQNTSYSNNHFAAPNENQILCDTGILVGAAGWRQIATLQNLEHILGNLHITVE